MSLRRWQLPDHGRATTTTAGRATTTAGRATSTDRFAGLADLPPGLHREREEPVRHCLSLPGWAKMQKRTLL